MSREPTSSPPSPSLAREEDGPVFGAPWEAQVFALAVHLRERGVFSAKEWTSALAAEIAAAAARGEPDRGDTYYVHWLCALEKLLASRARIDARAIAHRQEQWRRAYLDTPHGQPVRLVPASPGPNRDEA